MQKPSNNRHIKTASALIQGALNKLIASQLKITEATVKVHVKAYVEEIARQLAEVIALAHNRSERAARTSPLGRCLVGVDPGLPRYPWCSDIPDRKRMRRRFALTYAKLDGADRIEIGHLEAALAFCRYALDSANDR